MNLEKMRPAITFRLAMLIALKEPTLLVQKHVTLNQCLRALSRVSANSKAYERILKKALELAIAFDQVMTVLEFTPHESAERTICFAKIEATATSFDDWERVFHAAPRESEKKKEALEHINRLEEQSEESWRRYDQSGPECEDGLSETQELLRRQARWQEVYDNAFPGSNLMEKALDRMLALANTREQWETVHSLAPNGTRQKETAKAHLS